MVVGSMVIFGCTAAQKTLVERTAPGTEIRVFEVFGMDCPGCHGGVEKLVNKIDGIEASEADWEQKKLVVAITKGTEVSDEAITKAIRDANFTPGNRLK